MVTRIVSAVILTGSLVSYASFRDSSLFYALYVPITLFAAVAFLLTFRRDKRR